ncbi:enoyl-CoA hydratase-related protein [Albimonas pacifica]|uniref:Enoyl-CoA hydratase/carnithine racemase n=1 Tax=Albimonas pacifica TaxID=1114924 RepID=A0A1I3BP04_9RHOB|nr:enoyl-CoA hydratase-related protein [Albimonas pacifica]SFH63987.1 Enoyl-CoA hydratase/carnithine racemase [Albimonas pacifica]
MSELLYEVREAVAVLTLNRPERMNAWTPGLETLLRERFAQAEADPEARAILLTGAGRAFCAGADMDAVAAEDGEGPGSTAAPPAVEGDFAQRYSYLMSGRKPLICAINGGAAGVGFVLPLFADIRLVAEGAKLTTAFARRGFVAEHGSAWLLPRLIGPMNAADLLLSGRTLRGAEAASLGLARALPDAGFAEAAFEVARDLAANCSPRSMAVIKAQLRGAFVQTLAEATRMADVELEKCHGVPDMEEGVAHFLERRPAAFPPLPAEG